MNNPFYNAVLAEGYICLVAFVMFYGQPFVAEEDAVIMPIAALSLLVLSAAVMGYLFFYTPMTLFLEGRKDTAVQFFLKTVGSFAAMTLAIFTCMFLFT
jgi:uncharacterized membrane protein